MSGSGYRRQRGTARRAGVLGARVDWITVRPCGTRGEMALNPATCTSCQRSSDGSPRRMTNRSSHPPKNTTTAPQGGRGQARSGRHDSNVRPLDPQSSALGQAELRPAAGLRHGQRLGAQPARSLDSHREVMSTGSPRESCRDPMRRVLTDDAPSPRTSGTSPARAGSPPSTSPRLRRVAVRA